MCSNFEIHLSIFIWAGEQGNFLICYILWYHIQTYDAPKHPFGRNFLPDFKSTLICHESIWASMPFDSKFPVKDFYEFNTAS